MLLVMDVGNSNIVLGLYEGDKLRAHWRVYTSTYRTTDEFRILLGLLLNEEGLTLKSIRGVCVSSVVPQLNSVLMQVGQSLESVQTVMVGPGIKTGLILQYENPREVGADRIVNSVAAVHEYGAVPLVVIDFGTATTFDVITAKGEYRGGIIVPGIQVSSEALFQRCARLPKVEISKPASVVGRNTVDSIRAGLTYGYADMVDGLVERIASEMDAKPTVIATGGLAGVIAEISTRIEKVDSLLTLKGLKVIFEKNERGTA